MLEVIAWKGDSVVLIDQRFLPQVEEYYECREVESVAYAIKEMVVRGAPAIGVTAAMGMALAAVRSPSADTEGLLEDLQAAHDLLLATRPTAVNLAWALRRVLALAHGYHGGSVDDLRKLIVSEAQQMHRDDIEINRAIGRNGAPLLEHRATVLTHCNAGALATAGYGTALGVIRAACEAGKEIAVFADETRPFLQGARLTAWELKRDDIPVTVITDGMAGHVMHSGRVQAVVVGADRIAANGDTANKIGTYSVAVLAKENGIPFYVAAPLSTIDRDCASGESIPIEERTPDEVRKIGDTEIVPNGVGVMNPAFDVTPARYVTAIITEKGVVRPPYASSLAGLFS